MYSSSCSEFAFVNIVDHVDVVTILLVRLDAWVVNVGGCAEVVGLGLAVLVGNYAALLGGEGEELAFLGSRQTLEVGDTVLHL